MIHSSKFGKYAVRPIILTDVMVDFFSFVENVEYFTNSHVLSQILATQSVHIF
jgi:hypothetical protein